MQREFQNAKVEITNGDHFMVRVGSEQRTGDLYYLGIDPRNRDYECSAEEGLLRLIDGWIETIVNTSHDAVFYLPFDFSDEYTRWLECRKSGPYISMVFGWAPIEGWSFSPSEFSEYSQCMEGFQPDEPSHRQTFYTPRFLSNLRSSQAHIAKAT